MWISSSELHSAPLSQKSCSCSAKSIGVWCGCRSFSNQFGISGLPETWITFSATPNPCLLHLLSRILQHRFAVKLQKCFHDRTLLDSWFIEETEFSFFHNQKYVIDLWGEVACITAAPIQRMWVHFWVNVSFEFDVPWMKSTTYCTCRTKLPYTMHCMLFGI